jgi:type I restriction enzyme R subunit
MYNEADTRAKLIDPAIHSRGWTEDLIRREQTAGEIQIVEGRPRRRKGKIDYTLRIKVGFNTQPIAISLIEAKAENYPPNYGLEQAKCYAKCQKFNIPFVFSSNGHLFVEFNKFTGLTSNPKRMNEFPKPEDLKTRYEQAMGFSLSSEQAKPLLIPYTGGEATRRYYQDAAIRAVLEKIAQGGKRALLALATGSGKTFIAVHLLKKLDEAGQLKRALFLCDRDELRRQGLSNFQGIFGSNAAEVFSNSEGKNNAKNARIHVATYQTLNVDNEEADANFLIMHYPENYFSHIVIDECHRSAWGKWSQVLLRNDKAIQIGLTATPRQLEITENTKEADEDRKITADNIKHFGEPVYEYTMTQGIEDGYLAACEIQRGRVNLDDTGISIEDIIKRNPTDAITGLPVTAEQIKERYEKTEYEGKILLPDRVIAMCQDLFSYLIESGKPEQKTIIFCARDRHADDVAIQMNNLYVKWCRDNKKEPAYPYAFKCTAASGGSDFLPEFRGSNKHHFIATTVDLLSTGVDVPCVRNIVFFKYVKSSIAFHQMVGRGTRIDEPSGKMMFTVYDYTNATRLFGQDFITIRKEPTGTGPKPPPPPEHPILVDGFEVVISDEGRYILSEVDGRPTPVTVEEYKERIAAKILQEYHTLQQFTGCWIDPQDRRKLIDSLIASGLSPTVLQKVEDLDEYDQFDILAELTFGSLARTREQRADSFTYKNDNWLKSLPDNAALTLIAIAKQFKIAGTDSLENPHIFNVPDIVNAGGLNALKKVGEPKEVLFQTKQRIFAV